MSDNDYMKDLKSTWIDDGPWPTTISTPCKVREATVELSKSQKKIVIDYLLGDVGKGLFEDCEEFWVDIDGPMSQDKIDETYPAYRDAVDEFVERLREHLHTLI